MNKLALITGASKGLGKTLAEFLARQGYDLILTARGKHTLESVAIELSKLGTEVTPVSGDIADPSHRARLAEIIRTRGDLNLLVNNASTLGPTPMPTIAEYPTEAFRYLYDVNIVGPIGLTQSVLPALESAKGLIVNLSSDAAVGGYETWGGYGSAKAALDLLSLTLANELRDDGVSVVAVDPGDMRTGMHQDAFPGEDISDRPLPDVTLPFWGWLLGQDPTAISGQRFQAQAERWEVAV